MIGEHFYLNYQGYNISQHHSNIQTAIHQHHKFIETLQVLMESLNINILSIIFEDFNFDVST